MGFILEQTPEMGEYSGEVRRESFYLRGEYGFQPVDSAGPCPSGCNVVGEHQHAPEFAWVKAPHGIFVYPDGDKGQGSVEMLLEDIPKIRAVLDAVEAHANR